MWSVLHCSCQQHATLYSAQRLRRALVWLLGSAGQEYLPCYTKPPTTSSIDLFVNSYHDADNQPPQLARQNNNRPRILPRTFDISQLHFQAIGWHTTSPQSTHYSTLSAAIRRKQRVVLPEPNLNPLNLNSSNDDTASWEDTLPFQQQHSKDNSASSTPTLQDGRDIPLKNLSRVIAALETLPQAEAFLYRYARSMNAQHVAQFIVKLPGLDQECENARRRTQTLLRLATQSLTGFAHQLKPMEISGCIWALAKAGYSPPGALPMLASQLVQAADDMRTPLKGLQAHDVANLAWALATLKAMYGSSMQAPTDMSTQRFAQLPEPVAGSEGLTEYQQTRTGRQVHQANPGDLLWPLIIQSALGMTSKMSAKDVSRMAWSLASAGAYHKGIFNSMAERCVALCPPAMAKTLDPTTDSLAHMTFKERRMVYKQRRELAEKAAAASQEASNKKALVLQGQGSNELALAAPNPAQSVPSKELSSQQAANIAWAYTAAGHRHPKLFAALARAVLNDQKSLTAEDIASIAWSYSSWGFYDAPLINVIALHAAQHARHMSYDQLTRVLVSAATLHHYDEALWKNIAKAVSALDRDDLVPTPQQACNLLWAFSVIPPSQTEKASHQKAIQSVIMLAMRQLSNEVEASRLTTIQLLRAFWAASVVSVQFSTNSCRSQVAQLVVTLCQQLQSRPVSDVTSHFLTPIYHAGLLLGAMQQFQQLSQASSRDSNDSTDTEQLQLNSWGDHKKASYDTANGYTAEKTAKAEIQAVAGNQQDTGSNSAEGLIDLSYVEPLPMYMLPSSLELKTEHSVLHTLAPAWAEAALSSAKKWAQEQAEDEVQQLLVQSQQDDDTAMGDSHGTRIGSNMKNRQCQITGASLSQQGSSRAAWRLEVMQVLQDIGLLCEEKTMTVHSTLPVDISLVTHSGDKVAILLGYKSDYTRSAPHKLLGSMLASQELLRRDGWLLLHIPWYEWSLMDSEDEQIMYVYQKMIEHSIEVTSTGTRISHLSISV